MSKHKENFNLEFYLIDGVKMEWLEAYDESLARHIAYVQEAGEKVGVRVAQLAMHDNSKYQIEEFPHYARSFHGDRGDPAGFAVAWLHHQNFNPHHWEYWITRSDHSKSSVNGCLPMPESYVREMVADWMGASMTYTGKWEIDEWCTKNAPNMRMHPDTWQRLGEVLREMGYKGCVFDPLANTFNVRPHDWVAPPRKAIYP